MKNQFGKNWISVILKLNECYHYVNNYFTMLDPRLLTRFVFKELWASRLSLCYEI